MKRPSTLIAPLAILCLNPAAVRAQSKIIAEGYSAAAVVTETTAQRALQSMQQKNPAATLAEARLSVAQRGARMEAMRSAAEFIYGIEFEYSAGVLDRKMTASTTGTLQPGRCTYRTLRSGLIVASLELDVPDEVGQEREGLLLYEVTGRCDDENISSVVMAMRQARVVAIVKAVEQAIAERFRGREEADRIYSGTVWILRTVEDEPGIPYQVTLEVQVKLNQLQSKDTS